MKFPVIIGTALMVSFLPMGLKTPAVFAQKLEKITIGYPAPVASLATIDVIKKAGIFKKYGLDVELVYIQGSPILTAAMVSGQVPISFIAGAAVVSSAVGGADTVLLSCAINTLFWRMFTTPDIKTFADLKGKKIGVTRIGTLEDGVLRYLLNERGIDPERDVTFLAVGSAPSRLAALSKGIVHASSFIPPQDIAAEKLGLNELLDMSKLDLYNPASCLASTKSYVKNNRETVTRVMKAFVEGLKFYRENKEFAIKVTAEFARSKDAEVLDKTYEVVTKFQDRIPYVNPKGVDFTLKVVAQRDPRAKNFDPKTVVDSSFVRELEKSGFIDSVSKK